MNAVLAIHSIKKRNVHLNAAVTTLIVIVATAAAWVIPFAIIGGIFSIFNWSGVAAFLLAVMIAICVKAAFIDSYMMVKMMVSYMSVAPETEITFDLYGKLCKLSSKFKEMFNKAKNEMPEAVM